MSFIPLTHRTIIELKGDDSISFLQGQTTNDMGRLTRDTCLYTAFLNPQGKFMNDAFILMKAADHLWLDVETDYAIPLLKRLTLYKLRSKITLQLRIDIGVYACFEKPKDVSSEIIDVADPRSIEMGWRLYTTTPQSADIPISVYDEKRISLLIPDGARDIPYERGFIMEYGFDRLGAIDFQKGCYVGQELTARMHYRKLGKRQLACVVFDGTPPDRNTDIMQDGVSVGTIRSTCGHLALAHIRTEAIGQKLMVDGQLIHIQKII